MKVSVPGMPVTLLNMSKNDIYKMVSGDKMDVGDAANLLI